MVRAVASVQDQDKEWRDWKQILAERHKQAMELKEFNEWKKAVQKPQVKARITHVSEPRGRDLVKEVCNRFAF